MSYTTHAESSNRWTSLPLGNLRGDNPTQGWPQHQDQPSPGLSGDVESSPESRRYTGWRGGLNGTSSRGFYRQSSQGSPGAPDALSEDIALEPIPAAQISSTSIETANTGYSSYGDGRRLLHESQRSPPPLPEVNTLASWARKHMTSPRFKFVAYSALTAFVLFINLSFAMVATVKYGLDGGIGTLHEGSCDFTKRTGLWAHVIINVLGTLLLSASNYCMQCLCAPTRDEVDKAHARKIWLDIGVQSYRNLQRIHWTRALLWWGLALSSVPLHLMYNSAIFSSLAANEYTVAVVSEDFVTHGAPWEVPDPDAQRVILRMQDSAHNFTKFDPAACISAYSAEYISGRRDVIVVSAPDPPITTTNAVLGYMNWTYSEPQNSWICGTNVTSPTNQTILPYSLDDFDCNLSVAQEGLDSWVMANRPVQYCLSQLAEENCKLQFSIHILAVVVLCNVVKCICMATTGWRMRQPTLITLGDAIASFLEKPDPTTERMCLVSKEEIEKGMWGVIPGPREWRPKRRWWFHAGPKKWIACNVLCIAALAIIGGVLRLGLHNLSISEDIRSLWNLGFGQVTSSALIPFRTPLTGAGGLMANVLIANLPQAFLSIVYLTYDALYTSMLVAYEWSLYAKGPPRPLRVTRPVGEQITTYFLSLPYAYAIPLLTFSGGLHWLASQSIFLARVTVFGEDGVEDPTDGISTCGYSPIAIIFVLGIGGLIVGCGTLIGFRRYYSGVPLVGSCSAAISAGCHPAPPENDPPLRQPGIEMWGREEVRDELHAVERGKVMWGVLKEPDPEGGGGVKEQGHCGFGLGRLAGPRRGLVYAG